MCPLYSKEIERLSFLRRNDSSPFYFASSIDYDIENEEINKILSYNANSENAICCILNESKQVSNF